MTRPTKKRGFRPIVVDDISYRWRVCEYNRTADLEIHLESNADEISQRLCVILSDQLKGQWSGVFTPRIVSDVVRQSRNVGWCPEETGGDFVVDITKIDDDSLLHLIHRSNERTQEQIIKENHNV